MKKRYILGALSLVLLGLEQVLALVKVIIVAANKQLLVSQRSLSKRQMKAVVRVQNALKKI